ncbi:hypothetical protein N7474_000858 [Penicillium riverlandense]|uniref:uncharacterized protein n=1 Tax=Penicillium riverlandense TaxID=1903569 RepID=UPI0025477079|nr:uncharacterized protein N7474_000858 [Penicillium riverlandense]KAJ5832547.1 hypothetical protein N7474_000858 [Penicillium riverlandense]
MDGLDIWRIPRHTHDVQLDIPMYHWPTVRTMHLAFTERAQKAGYGPMSEFVVMEDRLVHNIHIVFETYDADAPKEAQDLVRNLLKDSITHRWEGFRTHPAIMDQMFSLNTSQRDIWKMMPTAAKDTVDSEGIHPGAGQTWRLPKHSFTSAWRKVIDEF